MLPNPVRYWGRDAVQFFREKLKDAVEKTSNKEYPSSFWRQAIKDNDQDRSGSDAKDILVDALRESLVAFIGESGEDEKKAVAIVEGLLKDPSIIIKRVALFAIRQNYQQFAELTDRVIDRKFFLANFYHEMWHLLHDCYPSFSAPAKQRVQDIIKQLVEKDNEGNIQREKTAYEQATWLYAIRNHETALNAQYQECVDLAGAEPEHPDASLYSQSGEFVVPESPKRPEELLAMGMDGLVVYLDGYQDPGNFRGPGIGGLVNALNAAVKAAPLEFAHHIHKFSSLKSPYVHALIEAFSELWMEKKKLPWGGIWKSLLDFCKTVIGNDEFWSVENEKQSGVFVANKDWVVGSIGQLIVRGTKSDDHAFSSDLLGQAKALILELLNRQTGEDFKDNNDAVPIAINSPRGKCLMALVDLVLRYCRLADKEQGDHEAVWGEFQPVFDRELAKPDAGEYEFITLVVNYLPNFLYMSRDWVIGNLDRIFDRENYQQWLCTMQAYAYVNKVYKEVYDYLKVNQHFIHALDDENLNDTVSKRIIQNIVIMYFSDHEDLHEENSLIRQLLDRARPKELGQFILFIWGCRGNIDQTRNDKVMELWLHLLGVIDTDTREGRKLASRLSFWSVFIVKVDDTNRNLLLSVAPFVEDHYYASKFLEAIARISATQPNDAFDIWKAMLEGTTPVYPEEDIRETLANLVKSGNDGRRDAETIVSTYIQQGCEGPSVWLREIKKQQNSS